MAGSTGDAESEPRIDGGPRTQAITPWPPLVALGLVVLEVGVVMNVIPLAVGGVVLFGGSIGGILTEASYVDRPWSVVGAVGAIFVVAGAAIWATQVSGYALARLLAVATSDPIAIRGVALLVGGLLLDVAAIGGSVTEPFDTLPGVIR
ncbi:MAG: cox cluster protein [Halanaeroarchaeum sp.]